ncbi:MAG TPA: thiamine-phosphate kinase [Ktedonobacterales bacterium]|jgi:thiamine-monophosphate kinase|nr:thiamine-phosphate kinase [Ktedonobacterales bacterium]
MRLDELGEFGLIARLSGDGGTRPDVLLGVGDDAAVLEFGGESLLVATVDAQVEGRHFLRGVATPEEIGHKALAVNLSDIAAMGAEPLWALISLFVPPDLAVEVLDGVYAGFKGLAGRFGVALVGGNVAATDGPLAIDVTLLGRAARGRVLTRAGGQPGDLLLVTGTLGAAAAGMLSLSSDSRLASLAREVLMRARQAQVVPQPRVDEGRALAATDVVHAMIDASDGLAADVRHLCERSGVGAELEALSIPVDPAAVAVATALRHDPLELALTGGEDYELLFSVRPGDEAQALNALREVGGSAHLIGRLTVEPGLRLRHADGREVALAPRGWDHLASS